MADAVNTPATDAEIEAAKEVLAVSMAPANDKFITLYLKDIRQNPHSLREVDPTDEKYQGILASVEADVIEAKKTASGTGVTLEVRKATDPVTGKGFYEVIDGGHRFYAMKQLGVESVHCCVLELNDVECLTRQVIKNVQFNPTKPVDIAAALNHIRNADKNVKTLQDLADMIHMSTAYVSQILKLNKIENAEIAKAINDGTVKLSNGIALLKLPSKDQAEFLETAIGETVETFATTVQDHLKVLKAAKLSGDPAKPREFAPVCFVRTKSILVAQLDNVDELVAKLPAQSVKEAVEMTLRWVLCNDAESVEAQKLAFDEKTKAKKEAAEKRAIASKVKAAKKAREIADAAIAEDEKKAAAAKEAAAIADGTPPAPAAPAGIGMPA